MRTRTIYIVDDNEQFRSSARWWLSGADYRVLDFGDPQVALRAMQSHPAQEPACAMLDVRMPSMSGLDLHDRLLEHGVPWPVIYMTGHGNVPLAVQAMRKGAITLLEKPFAEDALEAALSLAFAARSHGQASMPAPLAPEPAGGEASSAAHEWTERVSRLTPREREVLKWLLQDKLNKQISDLIGISKKTVELHRANLMRKLGARSATHLVKMSVSGRVE